MLPWDSGQASQNRRVLRLALSRHFRWGKCMSKGGEVGSMGNCLVSNQQPSQPKAQRHV